MLTSDLWAGFCLGQIREFSYSCTNEQITRPIGWPRSPARSWIMLIGGMRAGEATASPDHANADPVATRENGPSSPDRCISVSGVPSV